jgi:Na+-translocating ferredoxin:NAD+ oxidoreductase subunit A
MSTRVPLHEAIKVPGIVGGPPEAAPEEAPAPPRPPRTTTPQQDFMRGVWKENPVFIQLLGLCPALAVTNTTANGLAMGLASFFVLVASSVMISALKRLIPHEVRISAYILIIATFVTVVDLVLAAVVPDIHKALGAFIALIVVNCMILGRQEAFASKRPVGRSALDAMGTGLGFLIALVAMGAFREVLGYGTFMGYQVFSSWEPWVVMILPPGGFFTLGFILLIFSWWQGRKTPKPRASVAARRCERGGMMGDLIWILVSAMLVSNFTLALFLGLCPFMGVSSKIATALRMGLANIFVMTITAIAAWFLNSYVLQDAPFLRIISFIVVIASLVQIVEMAVKKLAPLLFRELGIFLPLMTTNCAILGLAIFQTNRGYNFVEGLFFAVGAGLGLTLALVLMASIREQIEIADVPSLARGMGLVLIIAGSLSLAFMGFAGLFSCGGQRRWCAGASPRWAPRRRSSSCTAIAATRRPPWRPRSVRCGRWSGR